MSLQSQPAARPETRLSMNEREMAMCAWYWCDWPKLTLELAEPD